MKRLGKLVFEKPNGVRYKASQGENGELIIRTFDFNVPGVYSQNYVNPPIPGGYKHSEGEALSGFVIERYSDGSQFVWIPVGSLDSNGTLDGIQYNEKFGRRNYCNDDFSEIKGFHEEVSTELELQIESVMKYGGFYFSRYFISRNRENGMPQSISGEKPWTNILLSDAKNVASSIEVNEDVKSHLCYGAELDSVLEWFLWSKKRTPYELSENSTGWGNYWNSPNSPKQMVETGNKQEGCSNHIYGIAGNVDFWTQEQFGSQYYTVRSGSYRTGGNHHPAANRSYSYPNTLLPNTGFRAALYLK